MNKKTLEAFNHIYREHIRLTQENQELKEKLENTFDHSIKNFAKSISDGFSRIFEMPVYKKPILQPILQRKRDKKGRFTK